MPSAACVDLGGQLVAAASILMLGAINYVGVRSGNLRQRRADGGEDRGAGGAADPRADVRRVTPSFTPIVPPDSRGRWRRSGSR